MEELEKRKIQLEISKLKTPWYKNLEFWKVFIPTIAILASLYFTVGQGVIDFEKRKLELQKEQLKLEILQFSITKKEIDESIKSSSKNETELINRISDLNEKKDSLTKIVQSLFKDQSLLKAQNRSLTDAHAKDKSFYQEELRKQYNNEKNYLDTLSKEAGENFQLKLTIASLAAEVEFLKKRIKLTDIERMKLSTIKNEAKDKEFEKKLSDYKHQTEKLNKTFEEDKKRINSMNSYELQKRFELLFSRKPYR